MGEAADLAGEIGLEIDRSTPVIRGLGDRVCDVTEEIKEEKRLHTGGGETLRFLKRETGVHIECKCGDSPSHAGS